MRINFNELISEVPELDPSKQAAYFWRTMMLLFDRIHLDGLAQIHPIIQQFIKKWVDGIEYDPKYRVNATYTWFPKQVEEALREYPRVLWDFISPKTLPYVWEEIFAKEYDYRLICYLLHILWNQGPIEESTLKLLHIFFDTFEKPQLNLETFDKILGIPLARAVVQSQDLKALGKLIQKNFDDPDGFLIFELKYITGYSNI